MQIINDNPELLDEDNILSSPVVSLSKIMLLILYIMLYFDWYRKRIFINFFHLQIYESLLIDLEDMRYHVSRLKILAKSTNDEIFIAKIAYE